jgi:rSAM/selenodomain-associated transferase 1
MNKNSNNALILFVKAPKIGTVKTRLQPELTTEQALLLYQAMVEDIVARFGQVGFCDLKIYFTPANSLETLQNWLGSQFDYFPQVGNDLGNRMYHALAEMLHQKYQKVVLAGSDLPTLDAETIMRAFTLLNRAEVVVGPSADGGYYLIGMKQPHPALFQGIAWSTDKVLQQTLEKARTTALDTVQLQLQSDIDTYADVVNLWNLLKNQSQADAVFDSKTWQVLKAFFNTG